MGFMCYYGHVQNTSNLGEGNVYKSYFLGALVEIPCWSVPFIIAKMGRRWPLLFLFTCSGICGVAYGFVPNDLPMVSLTVGLIGRMTCNGAYFICLQYSSEIFPTVIRGQGVRHRQLFFNCEIFFFRLPCVRLLEELPSSFLPQLSTLPSSLQSRRSSSLACVPSLGPWPPSTSLRQQERRCRKRSGIHFI